MQSRRHVVRRPHRPGRAPSRPLRCSRRSRGRRPRPSGHRIQLAVRGQELQRCCRGAGYRPFSGLRPVTGIRPVRGLRRIPELRQRPTRRGLLVLDRTRDSDIFASDFLSSCLRFCNASVAFKSHTRPTYAGKHFCFLFL